jgi:hypothetical protein
MRSILELTLASSVLTAESRRRTAADSVGTFLALCRLVARRQRPGLKTLRGHPAHFRTSRWDSKRHRGSRHLRARIGESAVVFAERVSTSSQDKRRACPGSSHLRNTDYGKSRQLSGIHAMNWDSSRIARFCLPHLRSINQYYCREGNGWIPTRAPPYIVLASLMNDHYLSCSL